ncbi:hypothetical protein, partial [Amycolatopsis sp.]|uniref:hypothetical protein n=1 Tax=Amycolatopsis sp. TaxID=37632 RepID=UPI002D7E7E13
AEAGHVSFSRVAKACAGKVMPSFDTVAAIVRGCGGTDDDVEAWRTDYVATTQTIGQLMRKLDDAAVVVPTRTDTGRPIRAGRLRPVKADVADPAAMCPNPEAAQTFDDLIYHTKLLRIQAGNPTGRALAKVIKGVAQGNRSLVLVGSTTLSDIFAGNRRPSSEQFTTIVKALLQHGGFQPATDTSWSLLATWQNAWRRAEFNRERPDLSRRRRPGKTFLLTEDKDEGPAAAMIAEMTPALAAALLSGLPPHIQAGIVGELPPAKAQAVIAAMHELGNVVKHDDGVAIGTADGTVLPMRPTPVPDEEGGLQLGDAPPEPTK